MDAPAIPDQDGGYLGTLAGTHYTALNCFNNLFHNSSQGYEHMMLVRHSAQIIPNFCHSCLRRPSIPKRRCSRQFVRRKDRPDVPQYQQPTCMKWVSIRW